MDISDICKPWREKMESGNNQDKRILEKIDYYGGTLHSRTLYEYKNDSLTQKFLLKLEKKGMDITPKEIIIQEKVRKEVKKIGEP